jgi:hypothetical protein
MRLAEQLMGQPKLLPLVSPYLEGVLTVLNHASGESEIWKAALSIVSP